MRRISEGYCLKYFLIIWFAMVLLTGCGLDTKEASGTGVYFDTVVDIKVCDDDADRLLKECFDICNDMESSVPMRRLVQGDVGSGKTVIAMLALKTAVGFRIGASVSSR